MWILLYIDSNARLTSSSYFEWSGLIWRFYSPVTCIATLVISSPVHRDSHWVECCYPSSVHQQSAQVGICSACTSSACTSSTSSNTVVAPVHGHVAVALAAVFLFYFPLLELFGYSAAILHTVTLRPSLSPSYSRASRRFKALRKEIPRTQWLATSHFSNNAKNPRTLYYIRCTHPSVTQIPYVPTCRNNRNK
jgi:hypothetical protein